MLRFLGFTIQEAEPVSAPNNSPLGLLTNDHFNSTIYQQSAPAYKELWVALNVRCKIAHTKMDVPTSLIFLFLGWLLGLLGPAIQERIKLHYITERIIAGIISELTELREHCSTLTVTIEAKAGRLTKELLSWQRTFQGERPLPPPLDQLSEVTQRLEQVDETVFNQLAARLKMPPGGGINLKELALPYTQTKLTDLELFSENGRIRILEILSRIRIFNQQVEESRFFFKLTFDASLSQTNHASASAQVQAAYNAASTQSRLIVELITLALKELKK